MTDTIETPAKSRFSIGWIGESVIIFAVGVLIALLVREFAVQSYEIPSPSMVPTLEIGDRVLVNKRSYGEGEVPERGDIAVFQRPDVANCPFDDGDPPVLIKRVIGLPGDTIDIEDGKIYINGSAEPLQEDYLKEEWTVATGPYTFEVPEGSYFMMGDNRNDSWDARYWSNTYVTKDKILGKALFTYWPFAHFGKLE